MSDGQINQPGADEICIQCGHPFNAHRLHGFAPSPTEGWIDCPVQGCTCKATWRMGPGETRRIVFPKSADKSDPI
jgi:hypothetical protein